MGHRLSKIYTRSGDAGTTGLANGSRVAKDSSRMQAIGETDELNSFIGAVLVNDVPEDVRECLTEVQHALFDLGGELAVPAAETITGDYVAALERTLDRLNADLPPLKEFILPGGNAAAVACHQARAVCRRAERRLVSLAREERINEESRKYVNRLSDLLFVVGRILARRSGSEVYWDPRRKRG
jgi:cob(I)alamin adenosyltransferase